MCMYIYIYVYICVYMYICICLCLCSGVIFVRDHMLRISRLSIHVIHPGNYI